MKITARIPCRPSATSLRVHVIRLHTPVYYRKRLIVEE